ncbi:MerR family transcriptional regulator [Phyllobacterium sp. OV277]|uniref:MerR family transcriptional regulator n=1 Tax=Phyllobacterium sp. OV277 TaxID=1882772 RepID=UPI00088F967C|nr:MerR family transcriptional regulator [Phyllobacterium sp. OV277]SDP15134.1 transcriptional regulator, MerR family [Phyllobacterium sp. OV277]
MNSSAQFLNPSEAARRLGVSAKALRLYEQRGLIAPVRTKAGWRTYGPVQMARAGEIAALRHLGLSLAQIARVLKGDRQALEPALTAHQAVLQRQLHHLAGTIEKVSAMRTNIAAGRTPDAGELAQLIRPAPTVRIAFDLPWPWGGEEFALSDIRALNYIIGPLGSGKTRLALAIAKALPNAAFIGLDRSADNAMARMEADPALKRRVDGIVAWLVEDGATASQALIALLVAMESSTAAMLVVDMVEQGLDQASQEALSAYFKRRGPDTKPLFLMTRSSAILDLAAVGSDETIIFCPANHSPPICVAPYPGAPGYEAVATCLASLVVRARTEGVIAWRPQKQSDHLAGVHDASGIE